MGLRATLASLLTAPLAAAFEERVRDLVDELVDDRGYADATMIQALSERLHGLIRKADAAQSSADDVTDGALDVRIAAQAAAQADLEEALDALAARIESASADVGKLRAVIDSATESLNAAEQRAEQANAAANSATSRLAKIAASAQGGASPARPVAVRPDGDRGCKVPGCNGKHRARGFCGKHYQLWRRGNLPGFVSQDGTLAFVDDGPRYTVGEAFAGEAATLKGKAIHIGDTRVPATAV